MGRRRVVEWFGAAIGLVVVVSLMGVASGLLAIERLSDHRTELLDRIDPAQTLALQVSAALVAQESAVRGYLLSREEAVLQPFRRGVRDRRAATAALDRLLRGRPSLLADVRAVRAAVDAWRSRYAEPAVADPAAAQADAVQARGRALFRAVDAATGRLDASLARERAAQRRRLDDAARAVTAVFVVFGVLLLLTVLLAAGVLRRVVVGPLGRLADNVRQVASGRFEHRVEVDGAREVVMLAEDVEAMRARIVEELEELAATRDELQRSNAELEQFAYVASHDLQEPLRKVASFTQMLQRRYEGQLDERADQYIGFAVDGARRMQDLINDLLAFSRVGRLQEPEVVVETADLVRRAEAALAARLEETGGRIVVEADLPPVRGEATLLSLVFQNLLGNGLKFHGDDPPVVRIGAERDGDEWRFTVSDNGIGVEPEYADRIFIIFQRLHPRTSYEGTGIGLAMVRKVLEHHGGRIWLDTGAVGGATFHFTLPAIPEETPAP